MIRSVAAFVACAMFLLPATLVAQDPTKESEHTKVVRYTRVLEERPLDPAAPQLRAWLLDWIHETPVVTVVVCDILGPVPGDGVPFGPELLVQYMAGNAAYQLQNPASRSDPSKPSLAGIASMLRAYQALHSSNPEVRIPVYDEWVSKQASGDLERERTAAIHEHCSAPASSPEAGVAVDQEVAAVPSAASFFGGFLRETRIVYPLHVGEWEARDEKRYDQVSHGVSVRYSSNAQDQGWIDVFVYPVGAANAGQVLSLAEREREGLIDTWLKQPRDDDISGFRTFPLASTPGDQGPAEPPMGHSLDLTYVAGDARLNSAMVVLFHQLYVVKTRFSVPEAALSRERVRESLERFTAQLYPRLTIASIGDCWRPLPVEHLEASRAAPDGHLLTVQQGGDDVVYVYAGRVLARDPDSPAVEVGMRKGMELLGRLHPGCNGAESVNPHVEDDMREIRIEYRPPAQTLPPAGRLQTSRRELG